MTFATVANIAMKLHPDSIPSDACTDHVYCICGECAKSKADGFVVSKYAMWACTTQRMGACVSVVGCSVHLSVQHVVKHSEHA